jgi:predicted nuclease of predicted toxin-antitoxin system
MRFVADENIDRQIVEGLRADGHDVLYVAEMMPGVSDENVLNSSNVAEAVLITADKDFGELIFRLKKVASGVVLIRLAGLSPTRKADLVLNAVRQHEAEFQNAFTVITAGLVRIRRSDSQE